MMDIQQLINAVRIQEEQNNALLHLTASEGCISETARQFLSWKLAERYYYGPVEEEVMDNGKFTALGLPAVTNFVGRAEAAVKEMLGAEAVSLYCLSGVHAMMTAILSVTEPGDGVMTIPVADGGHFATQPIVDLIGRQHHFAVFDQKALAFDVEQTAHEFHKAKAKVLYLDMSYYLNPHNLRELRQALGAEAIIIYDASHTMGLIMGQKFQNPFAEGADIVCANTHKTLPGPQKGMIAYKDADLGQRALSKVNFRVFSNPHIHHLLALSLTILEMQEFGRDYAQQMILNANRLGKAFEENGFEVRLANTDRYTENHQIHVFIDSFGPTQETYNKLLTNRIATHFNKVLGGRDFMRIGTQELTRKGMGAEQMKEIADLVSRAISGEEVSSQVSALVSSHRNIKYSFDSSS